MTRASGLWSRFSIATGSMGRRVSMDDSRKRENADRARFKLTKCIPAFLGGTHGAWSILCALDLSDRVARPAKGKTEMRIIVIIFAAPSMQVEVARRGCRPCLLEIAPIAQLGRGHFVLL